MSDGPSPDTWGFQEPTDSALDGADNEHIYAVPAALTR
jgi:hypothetical protein